MEKQTLEQLESRMDAVIEKLEELPVTSTEYEGLFSELRQLEAKITALTARRPVFSGINEVSTLNIGR